MPSHAGHPRQQDSGAWRRSREPDDEPMHPRDTADSAASHPRPSVPLRPRVRFMPSLEAPLLSKIATKTGFLHKQADNEPGRWNKYYFALKSTTYLYYYNSEEDAEPRGIIDVEFLRDVRFNSDCVQRSVGGSANCFRVTGQLPRELCGAGKDPNKTQFRPVYLDAPTRDDADAWMDAIRHHRFSPTRHREYEELLDSMQEVDARLMKLTGQAKEFAMTSQAVLLKGKKLLCKLRGVEMDDNVGRPRGMSHGEEDIVAKLRSIDTLFDEIFSEADQQRRLAEILRQQEASLLETREFEVEKHADERKRLLDEYEARLADLVRRERDFTAREKEMTQRLKEREQLCEKKIEDMEQQSSKWEKELEKEAARRTLELEKKRKNLEKQQKLLDQKQKKLDQRLKETPATGMLFGAMGKARSNTVVKKSVEEEPQEDQDDEREGVDADIDVGPAVTKAKSKSIFGRPVFMTKKADPDPATDATDPVKPITVAEESPSEARQQTSPESPSQFETDDFDSLSQKSLRRPTYPTAASSTNYYSDRSSGASTMQ